MSEVYAATCEHCGADAHMPLSDFQSIRDVKGAEWLPHYNMLCGASAGCVETVKAYYNEGGSVVDGKRLSVWDGSKHCSTYNAYRATFEHQSAATIVGQEETRDFLKTLPGASYIIESMEAKMKKTALLRCRDELLEGLHKNSGFGSAAGSGVIEVRMAKRKKICESPHADSPYARNLSKFHHLCYVGRTQDARRFLENCPDLLWDMSYSSAVQRNLRASDFCRLGKYEGHPTYVLYQELLRAEEMSLMDAAASASTCTLHGQCATEDCM